MLPVRITTTPAPFTRPVGSSTADGKAATAHFFDLLKSTSTYRFGTPNFCVRSLTTRAS